MIFVRCLFLILHFISIKKFTLYIFKFTILSLSLSLLVEVKTRVVRMTSNMKKSNHFYCMISSDFEVTMLYFGIEHGYVLFLLENML